MIEIRSLRDLLRLLFIFRREFVQAWVVTAIVVALGAFLLPNRYASDARLLVKPTESISVQLPVQPGNGDPGFVQQSPQRDPLLDEEKLATSAPVMRKVAEAYLAYAGTPPQGAWARLKFRIGQGSNWTKERLRDVLVAVGLLDKAPQVDRLAARLQKRLEAAHDPGSNVMELHVVWNDPGIAQRLSQAWVDAYFDERANAAGGAQLFDFYQRQSTELSDEISALKQRLRVRLRTLDATSVQQRIEDVTDQLQQLYRQRREATVERESLGGVIAASQARLPALSAEIVTEREVSLNPVQQDLRLKLNGLQAQRLDLLRNFREEAPPIKAVDESIRLLQAQIDAQKDAVQRSQNLAPNSLAVKLRQDVQDARIRIAQIDANLGEIEHQIGLLQKLRDDTMSAEPELSRITLQLSTAEKTFAQYSDYLLRARVIRDLNRNRLSNVTIVGEPTFAPSRVFPKSLTLLLLAIPAGLGVALLTVFVLYLMDQRIHDAGRMEHGFGIPVLTTLPDADSDARALRPALYRLYCRLPFEEARERGQVLGFTSSQHGEGVDFVAHHLLEVLHDRGHAARLGHGPAIPGEFVLVTAPPLSEDRALLELRDADRIVLVVQARRTTVPAVESAVALLRDALGHVDGIVLNRRVFEIPRHVWNRLSRWLGAG